MMKNIIHYLKLLSWKYFSFLRPAQIKIGGKLKISSQTKIFLVGNSTIDILGNADFTESQIYLEQSTLQAHDISICNSEIKLFDTSFVVTERAQINYCLFNISESSVKGEENFRIIAYNVRVDKSKIHVGSYFCILRSNEQLGIINLDHVHLKGGNNTRIQADINAVKAELVFGSNSFVNKGSKISCMNSIEIGDYVMISYDCDIIDNNSHPLNYLGRRKEIDDGFPNGTKKSENFEILSAPIIIKNDVWIGMKCLILKGVVISERSIVAANTKVNKSIESDTIYYGSRSKKLVYN